MDAPVIEVVIHHNKSYSVDEIKRIAHLVTYMFEMQESLKKLSDHTENVEHMVKYQVLVGLIVMWGKDLIRNKDIALELYPDLASTGLFEFIENQIEVFNAWLDLEGCE